MLFEQKLDTLLAQNEAIMKHLGIQLATSPESDVTLLELAKGDSVRSATLKRKADRVGIPVTKLNGLNAVKYKDVKILLSTKRRVREQHT